MTRAFRFHADISTSPKDYDDEETYTLDAPQIVRLTYQAIISKVNNVVTAKEILEAEEPLNEQVIASATLSRDGKSLTVMQFQGCEAEPQTLVMGGRHEINGGKYS
ncbi:hypothetical protein TrST_g2913 [Triparma strigata]|uniref:Uncharacterized protein n=1 Tax=Triparma strigata TaxID=1606541 RepID=A0A9W7BMZ1_9STRA|nr:hypothetical protein TrST_g2913 [Triparma strigata]